MWRSVFAGLQLDDLSKSINSTNIPAVSPCLLSSWACVLSESRCVCACLQVIHQLSVTNTLKAKQKDDALARCVFATFLSLHRQNWASQGGREFNVCRSSRAGSTI
jgi:hypothetical protein